MNIIRALTGHYPGTEIGFTSFKFSGGEINVKVDHIFSDAEIFIDCYFKGSDDIIEMIMLTDAIRRADRQNNITRKIHLLIPYMPGARQDRVMVPGESLAVKIFADLINAQNFDTVTVWDAHSDVTNALLNRSRNIPIESLIQADNYFPVFGTVIVSPDAGAEKKIYKFANKFGYKHVVTASKIRDVSTGQITETTIGKFPDFLSAPEILIVDDICDGGRTFIELAKALRKVSGGSINLLVTHGIFSKGIEVFDGLIDKVLVINNINGVVSSSKTEVITIQ